MNAVEPRLHRLLTRFVDRRRNVRHGLLAVARVDGSWSWSGAHGVADAEGTPATTATRYPIASVTKLFTAVVALRLVERGVVRLDDRMVDLLPADLTRGLHVFEGREHTDEITFEHLLSHTSGLPDYYTDAPPGRASVEARLLAGEDVAMPFDEVLRTVREDLTPHFAPQPLDAPKRKAHYADTNYQLVGAVIERLVGQPLHVVFDDMLFRPLALDDTSSYPHPPRSGASPEPQAQVWSKDRVLQIRTALRDQVADGGIVSTLDDQVRLLRAVVSGQVFERPETWPSMQQRLARVFFPIDYGLGVMRYAPARWMSPLYKPPPVVGHTGSTATWLFHCPQLDVVTAGAFDVAQPPLPFRFVPQVLRVLQSSR